MLHFTFTVDAKCAENQCASEQTIFCYTRAYFSVCAKIRSKQWFRRQCLWCPSSPVAMQTPGVLWYVQSLVVPCPAK